MEVVEKAKRAMTFVLLQEAACSIPQGFLLQQRRDVVFSQAVGGHSEIHPFSTILHLGWGATVQYSRANTERQSVHTQTYGKLGVAN